MQERLPNQWSQAQYEWLSAIGRASSPTERQRLLAEHPEWCRAEVVQSLIPGLSPTTPLEAQAWLEAAHGLVSVADTLNQPQLKGLTRLQLAYLFFFSDEFGRALPLIEQATRYLRQANDRLGLARALHLQAEVLLFTEGAERALPLYEQARRIYQDMRAVDNQIRCDYSLVRVYHILGQHERALQVARQAYALAQRQNNRPMQARFRMAEGIVLRALARYDEALQAYQQALDLWRAEQVALEQARVIANIGLVYWSMGMLTEARLHYAEAMPIFRASGAEVDVATCQLNTALILISEGDYLRALDMLQEAEQRFRRIGDVEGVAYCLLSRGEALEALSRLSDALSAVHQACVHFNTVGNANMLACGRLLKARVLLVLGRPDETSQTLRQAFQLLDQGAGKTYLPVGYFLRGEVSRKLQRYGEADRHYLKAVEHLSSKTALAGVPPEEMSRMLSQFREMVAHSAWYFAGRGRYETAFRILQQGKGVALRQTMHPQPSRNADLTPQEQRRLDQLYKAWEQAQRRATTSPQSQRKVAQRYTEWERYRRQLARRRPRWGAAQNLPLSPRELPLDNRTAVIEYALAMDGIGILVVRRQGGRAQVQGTTVRVPHEKVLATIRELRRAIETGASVERIHSLARTLYDWLVRPVESALVGVQQVIVCPDGGLHGVPWSVLQGADGRYLIERYALATSASATVWAQATRFASQVRPSTERPLMVAVSEFPSSNAIGTRANLSRLPGVRQEQAVFQRLFGRTANLLSERNAVPEKVMSALKNATLIHIASHAIPNFRLPLLSAFALYGVREPSWLYAQDILQSRLSARLAVLSACSTAEGALSTDGMMGLAWAFLLAGCPSVLTTLWKLPDEGVPLWIETFYTTYRQQRSVSQSARVATLRLLKDPRYRHPRYWSAWLVQGAN